MQSIDCNLKKKGEKNMPLAYKFGEKINSLNFFE